MAFISAKNIKNHTLYDTGLLSSAKELLKLARENGVEASPLNLEKLLKFLGITLVMEEGDESFSGCIEKRGNGYYISVNKYHPEKRKRFTIAHELGHYFLHRSILSDIGREEVLMREPSALTPIEREANNFAADLLMPEELFLGELRSGNDSASYLSDKFGVSIPAIKYRAYQLNIL